MKHFSKIALTVTALISAGFSCASDDSFYDSPRILSGKLLSGQQWEPFLPSIPKYSPYYGYYGDSSTVTIPSLEKGIAAEWNRYKPSVSAEQWYSYLFSGTNAPDLTPDEQTYLTFSDQVKPFVNAQWDWDYQGISEDDQRSMLELAGQAVQMADQFSGNPFLRQRALFQAIRLYHYAGVSDSVIAVTDRTTWESGEKTLTYWRMKAIKAGALRKLGQNGPAMALFAEVAENSPELIYLGYRNCMYIGDWAAGLAATKGTPTHGMMLFLKMVYEDSFDIASLSELAKIEPGSNRLEVAFLKQIAIAPGVTESYKQLVWKDSTFIGEEAWKELLSDKTSFTTKKPSLWNRFWHAVAEFFRKLFHLKPKAALSSSSAVSILHVGSYGEYVPEGGESESSEQTQPEDRSGETLKLMKLALSLAENKSVKNKRLYYFCAAEAARIASKPKESAEYAAKALTAAKGWSKEVAATNLFYKAMASLKENGVHDKSAVQDGVKFLQAKDNDGIIRGLYLDEVNRAYLDKGEIGNAAAAYKANGNRQGSVFLDMVMSVPEIDSLKAQLKKPADDLLKELYKSLPSEAGFNDLAANKFMRAAMFDSAVARFELCGESYWKPKSPRNKDGYEEYSNYLVSVNADATPDQEEPKLLKLNRLEVAKLAQTLSKKKNYDSLMKLGNLFYWDCGWHLSDRLWGGGVCYDLRDLADYAWGPSAATPELDLKVFNRVNIFRANMTNQQMAARFYEQAQAVAKTDEQRAKAAYSFVAARSQNWTRAEDPAYLVLDKSKTYDILKSVRGTVPFVDEVASRCSQLSDFLNSN